MSDLYRVTFISSPDTVDMFATLVEANDFDDAVNVGRDYVATSLIDSQFYRLDGVERVDNNSQHVRWAKFDEKNV